MKFAKSFIYYIIGWALSLGLFNLIAFVTPRYREINGVEVDKLGMGIFWAAYIVITISFIGQLAIAFIALSEKSKDKRFLNLPMISTSITTLIVTLVIGGICIAVYGYVASWIGIIACAITLVVGVISILGAKVSGEHAAAVEARVEAKTTYMRWLISEAEALKARADGEELSLLARNVYEEIRYSDPMSDPALESVEGRITEKFAEFSVAVDEKNAENAAVFSKELSALISERNAKCKILK